MATRCGWRRVRGALSHAGLLLALAAYTAVGGLVFRALEGPAEASRLRALQDAVLEGRQRLLAAGYAGSTTLTESRLHAYELLVHDACRGGVEVPALTASPRVDPPPRWTLLQGVFFASTVLTTIGYGNIAPVTVWGRAFCLVFALVGIPLTLTVIADLGVLLASAVSALPCWGRCRALWPRDERAGGAGYAGYAGPGRGRSALLALAAVLLLLVYLAAGAAMFTLWEDGWDFWDGFYFCFITMTTIGFGDLVPRHPSYTLLCTLYILVGLAMTSTIIELVRRQYASSWRRLQAALSESGPALGALGDALRRLGAAPDVHLRGVLAAVSLARLVPTGGANDKVGGLGGLGALGALGAGQPRAATADAQKQWEQALAAVLNGMAAEKAHDITKDVDIEADTKVWIEEETWRKDRDRGKGAQKKKKTRKPGKVIEIVIYETTV